MICFYPCAHGLSADWRVDKMESETQKAADAGRGKAMKRQLLKIDNIPAVVWGKTSDKAYLYVHGKCQNKESAENFAGIAENKGWQTVSFDLPENGKRKGESCDVRDAIGALDKAGRYVFGRWKETALYGCSIGAFFALHAYKDKKFSNCLFLSPVIDMEYLIQKMFVRYSVTERELEMRGEIPTPAETLSWEYYRYVKEHPVGLWNTPAHILFGGRDDMQTEKIMRTFTERFGGTLTVSSESEHSFLTEKDGEIVSDWLNRFI